MNIEAILGRKGRDVVTIAASGTVLDAIRLLVERNIGSLVVTEGGEPAGIFTERDILRLAASRAHELGSVRVGEVMTRDVITAGPKDDLHDVMGSMTENKIRHLPVVDGEQLVGIVSIGDVVNAFRLSAEEENSHLRQYIQGIG